MSWSLDWLFSHQLLLFTLIAAIGLLVQRINFYGLSVGSAALVFVAMGFGFFGAEVPSIVMNFGIVLFLFSIGVQAGPSFVATLKNDGIKLFLITALLISTAFIVAYLLIRFFNMDKSLVLGVISGALTSTPALATATESSSSTMVLIGYSLAYPFGVLGVIVFVRILPSIMRVDLGRADKDYFSDEVKRSSWLKAKSFRVSNPNLDKLSIEELDPDNFLNATISRLTHDGATIVPAKDAILSQGDIIKVVASDQVLKKIEIMVGPEVKDEKELDACYEVKQFILTNSTYVNKTLAELSLLEIYQARVTRIQRNSIEIRPSAKTKLRMGDKLTMAFNGQNFSALTQLFGNRPNSLSEDLLALFLGVTIGIFLSFIRIQLPQDITVDLGLSGGVLFAAILLSHWGKIGPVVWHLSSNTNKVVRELGLIFFFIGVGTKAGLGLKQMDIAMGLHAIVAGIVMTLAPMLVTALVLLVAVKMNILKVLGILTGGMTSTPALASISSVSDSTVPTLYYASVYPFALVLLIVWIKVAAIFW